MTYIKLSDYLSIPLNVTVFKIIQGSYYEHIVLLILKIFFIKARKSNISLHSFHSKCSFNSRISVLKIGHKARNFV